MPHRCRSGRSVSALAHVVWLVCVAPLPLAAQTWNDEAVMALVDRAIARRAERRADTSLQDYRARAHGFVFFLGQLGEGLTEPPRLIKSDELVLEVYWKAPARSKQRIVGWRDRADLPTDIQYHRDHLGIVQNNFGDRIRLGHGDEVRDVPHPLARDGPRLYDYQLGDPLTLTLPQREVRVREVLVRPQSFDDARVVGSLFIDVETAELVIFRFSFTRRAYIDRTLEDITILLQNGLWAGRWWLPWRQEVEIRRRTAWLDLPARGVIRGRWEIRGYDFNVGLADSVFWGPEIVAAPPAVRDTFVWDQPLTASIERIAGPQPTLDLEEVRGRIGALAGARILSGLPVQRPSVGSLSDLLRFNRVEGLAVGLGWVVRPGGGPFELRLAGSYGVADGRGKGRLETRYTAGGARLALRAAREIVDVGDEPVIAPAVNSFLAQELGIDYGDYVLRERLTAEVRYGIGARTAVTVSGGVARSTSVDTAAAPVTGSFRPNPALGTGTFQVGRIVLERRAGTLNLRGGLSGAVAVEGGRGEGVEYVRVRASGTGRVPVGRSEIALTGWLGWGSRDLPLDRSFMLGGRDALVGEPFRAWGGRRAALAGLEWRVPVPFPAVPLGPFASTGDRVVVAPFVRAGWADGGIVGAPWQPTDGVRPVAGVGLEWFHRLLRTDVGVSLLEGRAVVVVDVRRDLWGLL